MHVPRLPVAFLTSVFVFVVVATPGRTFAQQAHPLSYADAARALRDGHGGLRAADALVRQREAERAAARGLHWPTVTFGATAVQMSTGVVQSVSLAPLGSILPLPPTVHLPELDLELQASRFAMANVTARYLLYTGGKAQAANRAAEVRIDEARAAADREASACSPSWCGATSACRCATARGAVRQRCRGPCSTACGTTRGSSRPKA